MRGPHRPGILFRKGKIMKFIIREILPTQDTEIEIFYNQFVRTGYVLTEM